MYKLVIHQILLKIDVKNFYKSPKSRPKVLPQKGKFKPKITIMCAFLGTKMVIFRKCLELSKMVTNAKIVVLTQSLIVSHND